MSEKRHSRTCPALVGWQGASRQRAKSAVWVAPSTTLEHVNSPPLSLAPRLALLAGRVLQWALRNPWAASPAAWAASFGAALVALGAAIYLGAPWWALAACGALIALPLIALFGWGRLLTSGDRPVLFLAQFRPATPGATEASLNHQQALQRRLDAGEVGQRLDVRVLQAPLREPEAERLLEASGAEGVVCGEVQASGGAGTFRAVLLQQRDGPEETALPDRVDENQRGQGRSSDAIRHSFAPDYRRPLEDLIGERYEAEHLDGVEGTVLVSLAEQALAYGDRAAARDCTAAAAPMRAALDLRTRAHLEVARIAAAHPVISAQVMRELEAAGRSDAGHPDLWKLTVALSLAGWDAKRLPIRDVKRVSRELAQVAPDDTDALYLLGQAEDAANRAGRALNHFERILDAPEYRDDYELQMQTGVLAYNSGRTELAERAYRRAVELHPTARSHLYLADALSRRGQREQARVHYREALLLQPDLVDAHRGFWWNFDGPGDPSGGPWFDRLYQLSARLPGFGARRWRRRLYRPLLRWHYRRHPEDSRIHFMLGAHALLLGDLDTAEQRLTFAYELLDGNDLEALARLAVVSAQRGDWDKTREHLQTLHHAPNPETGRPPSRNDVQARYYNLLLPIAEEPRLVAGEIGERLLELLVEVFGDVVPAEVKDVMAEESADADE